MPAISGSEFYIKRISEILARRADIVVHTTNAVDFSAFYDPHGKVFTPKENPERVKGVLVHRHTVDHDAQVARDERALIYGDLHDGNPDVVLPVPCGPISRDMRISIELESADVIHTTAFPHENIFLALRCARRNSIPIIVTPFVHGENPRYAHGSISLLKHFDRVLACSNAEKEFLERAGVPPSRVARITMGVDIERFNEASTDPFYRVSGFDPLKTKIVLFSGYKNFEKGAVTLLRAVPGIARACPDVKLVMIGPATTQYNVEYDKLGKFKRHVLNLTPSNLSGYFDKIKLGAFKACDVYAMPSRSEAYGIAYLEAWASKKPVIASDIPAMQELFQDGVEGFHVPFDDALSLATTITGLLLDVDHARELGLRGHEKIVRERLTWNHVATRVHEFYQELTGHV
nr:glycosyltransferase family 4 protein [Candidatus Sigynarchaeota archaeon]